MVAFMCLLVSAAAAGEDRQATTDAATARARSCDDEAARTFAQVAAESAEVVARAAFEKCRASWMEATEASFTETARAPISTNAGHRVDTPRGGYYVPSDAEMRANPYLLSESLKASAALAERKDQFIENQKRAEVERLLVVVLESRLENPRPR